MVTYEWIKKMWYVYTMGYYSAIKKEGNHAICNNVMKMENVMEVK